MLKWLTWAIPLKAQRNKDENYADSKCKPTSPGRRFVEKVVHDHLHKGAPYAPLVEAKKKNVLVVVITTVTLLLVTLVVVISNITVSLTSNVTKMAYLLL